MGDHSELLYLLCNPQEPMVMSKGRKKKYQFVVPSDMLVRKLINKIFFLISKIIPEYHIFSISIEY